MQQYTSSRFTEDINLFVADFVGNPSINFVEARGNQQEDGSISLDILGGVKVKLVTNENVKLSEWFEKKRQ